MTIRLDDPRLANEIRSLVDRRIAYAMQHLIGDVRYGTVTAVDAPNFRCSVSLGASPNASPGFAYPAHILPAVGDQVRVIIRGADRYIDEVLDGDASTLVERQRIGRSVYANTTQAIASATTVRITHQVANWFDDGTTSYTSGTMNIGKAGLYAVTAHVEYTSSNAGPWRILGIGRSAGGHPPSWGGFGTPSNNVYAVSYGTPGLGSIRHSIAMIVPLAAGDSLASFAYQDSGASQTLSNAELTIVRLGP